MKQTSTKRMIVILTATFFAIMIAWFLSQTGMQVYAATLDNNSKTWSENSEIDTNVTIDGGVTVDANITLKIPKDTTLTVNGGINAEGKTLTVKGEGKLIVRGSDGSTDSNGGNGFTGNLIVNGTDVTVSGGNGGNGRTSYEGYGDGVSGGTGGNGVVGTLTVNSGSATITGGSGGYGGNGSDSGSGGNGGNGGSGVVGTLTVNSGSATITGGYGSEGGVGGWGGFESRGGHGGHGGYGGSGVTANLIVSGGFVIVTGGNGGSGGSGASGDSGGNGGHGGYGGKGVDASLTVSSGFVTVTGGDGGSGGDGGYGYNHFDGESGNGSDGGIGVDGIVTISDGSATVTGGSGGSVGGGDYYYFASAGDKGQAVKGTITALASEISIKESDDNSNWAVINSGDTSTKQYIKTERHDFTYKASGDTITAACSNEGCILPNKKVTLTIKAPTLTTYGQTGEGISKSATLIGLDAFKAATELNVLADSIRYYKATKNGNSYAKDGNPLASAPSNAGDYLAEITLSGVKTSDGDNQSVTASVGYTIAPKPVTATVTAIGRGYEEGNTSVLLTAGTVNDVLTGDTVTVDVSDATGTMADDKAGPNKTVTVSGVKLAGKDAGNYTLSEQPSGVKVTINKVTAGISTVPDAEALTYSGSGQGLVTSGAADGGTMVYALGDDAANAPAADPAGTPEAQKKWKASIPEGTDAGSYYVWFKASGDENHLDSDPACVTAEIKKAEATVTAKAQTIKEGTAIGTGTGKAELSGQVSGQSLSAVTLEVQNGEIVPSGAVIRDAGNKDVTDNYNISYQPGTLTVLKKISHKVTFRVVNGSWNDGSKDDKTVTLEGHEGDTLKLSPSDIPEAGDDPDNNYRAGGWDTVPDTETAISEDTTYTYSYIKKDPEPVPEEKKSSAPLLVKMTAKGKKNLKLSWTGVQGAEGYDIFFSRCNHGKKHTTVKQIHTVKAGAPLTWVQKGLRKHTAYKARVKAYVVKNGKKQYIKSSPAVHAYTSGYSGKYTNPKSVKVNRKVLSLTPGKTVRIKAKVIKLKKEKRLMPAEHAVKLRYLTTNTDVATVSRSGKITAKGKGSCRIYAITVNGLRKTMQVTVK